MAKELHPDQVQAYFQRLKMHDTLKYRFCDVIDPEWSTALKSILSDKSQVFFILDEDKEIYAEFTLDCFAGKAAQIHFSTSPLSDTKRSLTLASEILIAILQEWTLPTGEPFLQTVYGMTPTKNRAACIFVLKAGLKKQGVLPWGSFYMGEYSDVMMTVKTRKENGK